MSELIVEVSTFGANVTVPTNGDLRDAASVKIGFQELSNRTRRLKDLVESVRTLNGTNGIKSTVITSASIRASHTGDDTWKDTLTGIAPGVVNEVGKDLWTVGGAIEFTETSAVGFVEVRIKETVSGLTSTELIVGDVWGSSVRHTFTMPPCTFVLASASAPTFIFQVKAQSGFLEESGHARIDSYQYKLPTV